MREISEAGQKRRWWMLAFWLVVVFAVSLSGSVVVASKIATWYAGLAKPWFTPPNWLFAPVWTVLYAAMALAVWRIGIANDRAHWWAIGLFVLQLTLNGVWSPVFFGLESPKLALAIIVGLVVVLVETIVVFWRLDRPAGILLLPYLAWVLYASLLNASIAVMN